MLSVDVSQCSTCKHLKSWVVTGSTSSCAAFPAGMPDAVWSNTLDHRQALDGDRGVRWESNGEPYPAEREWPESSERLAGHDTHPGAEGLKHYWTEDPEGLAKWVDDPHPYTALYQHLLEHMDGDEAKAHTVAGAWYFKVFGHGPTAGHHDGRADAAYSSRWHDGKFGEVFLALERAFNPDLHPRYPPGTPGGKGGKFMSKVDAANFLKNEAKTVAAVKTPAAKATKAQAKKPAKAAAAVKRTPAKPVAIRDLFTADDATIEAALRDVYEGQFGPYTTKVKVYITRAGTRVDKKGREHAVDPSIGVDGKVYDAQGHEIGYFGRGISPVDLHYQDGTVRRQVWANHDVVQLGDADDKRHQGKGFGGAFNGRAIEWYRSSGVHGISQSDHNGYVWASQGFSFHGGVVPDSVAKNIQELITDLRAGKTKSQATKDEYQTIPKRFRDAPDMEAQIAAAEELLARLETTKPGDPDYPTAYEISQLGRRHGQRGKTALWLGKLLWVSADEMILNPDEGEVISQ